MAELNNRTALITGAGSGIGWESANLLAAEGARIIAVDRNPDKLATLIENLAPNTSSHCSIVADLRPSSAAQQLIADALKLAPYIDIVINSAGVCHFNKMKDITAEEWD